MRLSLSRPGGTVYRKSPAWRFPTGSRTTLRPGGWSSAPARVSLSPVGGRMRRPAPGAPAASVVCAGASLMEPLSRHKPCPYAGRLQSPSYCDVPRPSVILLQAGRCAERKCPHTVQPEAPLGHVYGLSCCPSGGRGPCRMQPQCAVGVATAIRGGPQETLCPVLWRGHAAIDLFVPGATGA